MNTKKVKKFILGAIVTLISSCYVSCGSLDQWSQGLQAVGNSLSGVSYYNAPASTYSTNSYTTTTATEKEWHDCSSCGGHGRCKYCSGSGKNEYTKNGRCGVCRGTGKCAGCNGKGGWNI